MAVNNTLSVKEYALTGGGTSTFPITFEFTTDDNSNAENIHCQLAEKNDVGEYTNSVELTAGVGGDFQVEGGNVKFLDGLPEYNGKFLVIYRSTPVTQLTDFIDNGNYSLEDIERALDKLTFIIQERTGTPIGTYINVGVSLFFASILQLTNKKEFLSALFGSWADIDAADRPGLAASIRAIIDAVSKSGDETVGGHKTFTYSPQLNNDPQTNNDATRKSYVDDADAVLDTKIDTEIANRGISEAAINARFPVQTADIGDGQITRNKIRATVIVLGEKTATVPAEDRYTFTYYVRSIFGQPIILIKEYEIISKSGYVSWSNISVDATADTVSITASNHGTTARTASINIRIGLLY